MREQHPTSAGLQRSPRAPKAPRELIPRHAGGVGKKQDRGHALSGDASEDRVNARLRRASGRGARRPLDALVGAKGEYPLRPPYLLPTAGSRSAPRIPARRSACRRPAERRAGQIVVDLAGGPSPGGRAGALATGDAEDSRDDRETCAPRGDAVGADRHGLPAPQAPLHEPARPARTARHGSMPSPRTTTGHGWSPRRVVRRDARASSAPSSSRLRDTLPPYDAAYLAWSAPRAARRDTQARDPRTYSFRERGRCAFLYGHDPARTGCSSGPAPERRRQISPRR